LWNLHTEASLAAVMALSPPFRAGDLAMPVLQVKPYYFDFQCNVRQRWFGQNIIDIFTRASNALLLAVSSC
jgi:hypothetical protein